MRKYLVGYNQTLNYYRKMAGLKTRQCYYELCCFSPAEGQEKAFQAIQSFTDEFIAGENPTGLLLVGGVGSGKTFMASSVVNNIVESLLMSEEEYDAHIRYDGGNVDWYEKPNPVRFISVVELVDKLRAFYSDSNPWGSGMLMTEIKEIDLLILDDLGAEKASDWVREKLFEIIDYRYNEDLPLIVTTNCVPDELKEKIGSRNFDRLREMCAMVPVTAKSQRVTATL